ncbi:MAG: hypothetical protein WBA22_07435 [Candidatus Methanofastidiosia archaeon]
MAERESIMVGMNPEKMNEILDDIAEDYEKNKILISLSPSGYRFALHPQVEDELTKKFHLGEEDFDNLMSDVMLFVMSFVMDKEEKVFEEYGKTDSVVSTLATCKQKLKGLVESLRFKLFCKTQYLEDLTWDASIRVRQNGGIKMRFPFSMIRMSFSKPDSSFSSVLGGENEITFECTLQDVEKMIESLGDIKNALIELQKEG